MEAEKEKVVDDPVGKVFNKIGITGIASAILTIVFGCFIILYELTWDQVRFFIGLFFVLVGIINLGGYIYSIYSRRKGANTYIETETLAMK